jgi:hypothetical protein
MKENLQDKIEKIKKSCAGREIEVFKRVAMIPLELLDGKQHPCPKCGGKDRFSLIDRDRGAIICRKCFNPKNGDYIAAVAHFRELSIGGAIYDIERVLQLFLNTKIVPSIISKKTTLPPATIPPKKFDPAIFSAGNPVTKSAIAGLLHKKEGITVDSLIKAGAVMTEIRGIPVVTIPIYGDCAIVGAVGYRADGDDITIQ